MSNPITHPEPNGAQAAERFGCREVTSVGDRGMIKSAVIDQISFYFTTS